MTCPPTCRLASEPCLVGAPLAWPPGRATEAFPQGPPGAVPSQPRGAQLEVGEGLHLGKVFSTQGYWWPGHRCSSATLGWKHVLGASWMDYHSLG